MQPTKITTPDTLWNTFYLNEALNQLRAEGYPVRDRDVERLSPFIRKHLGVHGRYNFVLPDLGGGLSPRRRDQGTAGSAAAVDQAGFLERSLGGLPSRTLP